MQRGALLVCNRLGRKQAECNWQCMQAQIELCVPQQPRCQWAWAEALPRAAGPPAWPAAGAAHTAHLAHEADLFAVLDALLHGLGSVRVLAWRVGGRKKGGSSGARVMMAQDTEAGASSGPVHGC